MSAAIDQILNQLDKVRPGKQGHWMACCPAHNDQSPSLSIKQEDDSRILLYCFVGCTVVEITAAIGLSVSDLYPDTKRQLYPMLPDWKRARYEAAYRKELLFMAMVEATQSKGIPISEQDKNSYQLAKQRVRKLKGILNG